MEFALSADDLAFREEVRSFLKERLTPELREAGARMTSVFIDKPWSIAWQKILHEKGWVAPDWPVEYGGTGWTETQRYIFASECALASAPALAPPGCCSFVRPAPSASGPLPSASSASTAWPRVRRRCARCAPSSAGP